MLTLCNSFDFSYVCNLPVKSSERLFDFELRIAFSHTSFFLIIQIELPHPLLIICFQLIKKYVNELITSFSYSPNLADTSVFNHFIPVFPLTL